MNNPFRRPPKEERIPRPAFGAYKRFLLAGLLIVLMTAATTATAALLQIKDVVDILREQPGLALRKGTITAAQAGKPQTLLLLGSDKRFDLRDKGQPARSDTMMLIRLDPNQAATTLMSIPRDLEVQIPGVRGISKINAAYSIGGADLAARTVKELLHIPINHIININFRGFRRAVDYIGCVYVDVDRRYYHSNAGLPPSLQYSEINIEPGYQRLCGQDALAYVRYRHTDSDIVRAARQQDFLSAAKSQVGQSSILSDLKPLVDIFARNTQADSNLKSESGVLRLLKLAAFSTGHPVREIHFPVTYSGPQMQTLTVTPQDAAKAAREFLHGKASTGPRKSGPPALRSKSRRHHRRHERLTSVPGIVDARQLSENQVAATVAKAQVPFPVYFPTKLTIAGRYSTLGPNPYVYTLRDRANHVHHAYRLVIEENALLGQYYGVQGVDWLTPPILSHPNATEHVRGHTYLLYGDGTRLRLVAWRTPKAAYWVSNTLSLDLTNRQMLAIAESLTRFAK
ncbi:MAG TPA: LCP family protein [Solirubrobacteraceae bacterium]|nr:LCP family protein [Solirubrobacteraceae bacterium]